MALGSRTGVSSLWSFGEKEQLGPDLGEGACAARAEAGGTDQSLKSWAATALQQGRPFIQQRAKRSRKGGQPRILLLATDAQPLWKAASYSPGRHPGWVLSVGKASVFWLSGRVGPALPYLPESSRGKDIGHTSP